MSHKQKYSKYFMYVGEVGARDSIYIYIYIYIYICVCVCVCVSLAGPKLLCHSAQMKVLCREFDHSPV
jgi:hypothetical protein